MVERVRLGELLVEAGVLSRDQLEQVLDIQKKDGRRLGTLLIDQGLVSETQVTQILSQQLSVPWVSLYHIDFSRQLLNLVPREIAETYCLVPIFVRRVRGIGETLYVAMDDPSDERARDAVAEYSGLAVRTMIAPPSDIRSAIRAYYTLPSKPPVLSQETPELEVHAGDEAEVQEALAAESAERVAEQVEMPSGAALNPAAAPAPVEVTSPSALGPGVESDPNSREAADMAPPTEQLPVLPVRERPPLVITEPGRPAPLRADESQPDSSVPLPSRQLPHPTGGKRPQMITLTLLDGTRVTLPARRSRASEVDAFEQPPSGSVEHALTAGDLVEALRAVAHGNDVVPVLGREVQWEAIMGALLSMLLKKHLVADWEFVEEYEQFRKD
jgi:type IV pilus assembly protein PilB